MRFLIAFLFLFTFTKQAVTEPSQTERKEILCLTENIYHEARGEGFYGMVAVAKVTLNRTKAPKYPESICDVVHQPHQFSWVKQGKKVQDYDSLLQSYKIAIQAEKMKDPTKGATHYYAHRIVTPNWAKSMKDVTVIKNHTFGKTA